MKENSSAVNLLKMMVMMVVIMIELLFKDRDRL